MAYGAASVYSVQESWDKKYIILSEAFLKSMVTCKGQIEDMGTQHITYKREQYKMMPLGSVWFFDIFGNLRNLPNQHLTTNVVR